MFISDDQLYNLLQKNQYLTDEQLKNTQIASQKEGVSFYSALLEKNLISDEDLTNVIADYLNFPYTVLSKLVIPDAVIEIIPETVAKKNKIIAFELLGNKLKVATTDPQDNQFLEFLKQKTDHDIKVYYSSPRDIDNALGLYKKNLQKELKKLTQTASIQGVASDTDAPITKILDLLIDDAYYHKASDIHIEPRKDYSLIRFRVDGVLHKIIEITKDLHEQIISRIKVLSDLRTDEHLSAQDGKMQLTIGDEELDIRVSVLPIVQGEKAALRLLTSSRKFSLADLGFGPSELLKLEKSYQKPYGMILVTGPTGSGKTTTVYGMLKILNTPDKNIATIEDPVEYEIEGTNQIHVNPKTNLTFAHGLRSILRQDPNIILVGEIRDQETADIAVNAAMTGHLVLSTLHTNDAATAIPRLLDMKVEPFLVSSTLTVIVGQRLVRTICPKCKMSDVLERTELSKSIPEKLTKKYFSDKKNVRVYVGKGCNLCNRTGFLGRVGIFEVLEISKAIRELINERADSVVIRDKAIEEGMITMIEDGLRKVQQSFTTIEEVFRATKE